ncbi:MAG: hypothetical protein MMC33_008763 [Icmadophila ericetorum]|nr:hypothetical protein [Icmadophila ericetorum]
MRSEFLHSLKPVCVNLTQIALRYETQKSSKKEILQALEQLLQVLEELKGQPSVLDRKLSDYIFFPLSHLFRQSAKLPTQATNVALKCLEILISCRWCQGAEKELRKQILILLGYLVGGRPTGAEIRIVDEDVTTTALHCLRSFYEQNEDSRQAGTQPVDADAILVLGHTVTIILDVLKDGPSGVIKLAAVEALYALVASIADRSTLCRFLPGIVSSVTKLLSSGSRAKEPYRVLKDSLRSLALLIRKTLGPNTISRISEGGVERHQEFGNDWMDATSGQVKIALATIVQLRYHEHVEVGDTLFDLCITILRDCRETLAIASALLTETALIISSHASEESSWSKLKAMHDLIESDANLLDTLQLVVHDWISALPRVMQSNDTVKQRRQIKQISVAYRIAAGLSSNISILDHEVGVMLCESVGAAVRLSITSGKSSVKEEFEASSTLVQMTQGSLPSLSFEPLPLFGSSQADPLSEMERLVKDLDTLSASASVRRYLAESLESTSNSGHLACLWLASRLATENRDLQGDFGIYVDYSQESTNHGDDFGEILYSHSVGLLSSPTDGEDDWRLRAIALEVVAFRSSHAGQSFRPELVDVLYPVLECLGANNQILQRHAVTCLNILAQSCSYGSASELLIQNVDYLINSIALKFNTFDLRPQGPQVLLTMIQICGPTLIPYLDDLVESVFSALASFHGYARLVKLFFSILETLVNEGSKGPKQISPDKAQRLVARRLPSSISEVALCLQSINAVSEMNHLRDINIEESKPCGAEDAGADGINLDIEDSQALKSLELHESRRASKSYSMVQLVVHVGQYYLTHDSPVIRRQILNLTSKGCVALYRNEDKFLPLVNDIWPVVIKRLYDSESYVSVAAAGTIGNIIRYAGDFMSSRIVDEWHNIQALYGQMHAKKLSEQQGRHKTTAHFTSAYQIWDALVGLCCRIVEHLRVNADMEDDLLNMLGPYANSRLDVRTGLDKLNPDALWLVLESQKQKGSEAGMLAPPIIQGYTFSKLPARACL